MRLYVDVMCCDVRCRVVVGLCWRDVVWTGLLWCVVGMRCVSVLVMACIVLVVLWLLSLVWCVVCVFRSVCCVWLCVVWLCCGVFELC